MTRRRLRDSPLTVASAAAVTAVGFVGARLAFAAEGDVTRFVLAGSMWAGPEAMVTVQPGPGYDGQFAYRMAVDPAQLDGPSAGITLDAPLRLQRLSYPVLAFVVSLGRAELVPWALVVVNVLGLTVIALLAARIAVGSGRSPWTGAVVAGYFGFATTLGRDLTEIVTVALLLAALEAFRRGSQGLALLAASLTVLSRETAVVLYLAFVAGELVTHWRSGRRPSARWFAAASVPVGFFVAWQAICWSVVGQLPLMSSGGKNAVLPGTALLPAVADWVQGALALERANLITLAQLTALTVTVCMAARALRVVMVAERFAWVAALVIVLSLSDQVWRGPADFRTSAELYVLSVVVLLRSDRRLSALATLLGLVGIMTALFRITSL